MKLLEIIDSTFIGKLISKWQDIIQETDPDRIYVENVRSFFNIPTKVAKFLCELAVRQGLFKRRIGIICENEDCERIILTINDKKDIPSVVECHTCKLRENPNFEQSNADLQTITFYQLVRR